MSKNWKNIPLGIPLTIASLGTIAALGASKRLHVGFGILWAGLSLWHGLQHCRKMRADARRLEGKLLLADRRKRPGRRQTVLKLKR